MKTKFIPLDYDSFDFEGKNYMKIIGRDEKGKRICIIDSCDIFLWAILKEKTPENKIKKLIEKIEKIELDSKGRKTKVEKVEVQEKKFLEKNVLALKIYATNHKDLPEIASNLDFPEIENRRGMDISFTTHYITERKIEPLKWYEIEGEMLNNSFEFGGIDKTLSVSFVIKLENKIEIPKETFSPKILAYDIETDELQIGKGEIVMLSLVSDKLEKVITWKGEKKNIEKVEFVKNEKELLEKFRDYVKKEDPDFLVGYFSDGFDMPYIKARAEKNKIRLNLGLDDSIPKISKGAQLSSRINGIVHIDILRFIRTVYSQYMKSETLSLNEVAKEFLGEKKVEFELKHSSKIKDGHWAEYYKYNLQDSILTKGLFEKSWQDILELVKIIKEPPYELTRAGLSKYWESYILHNLEKFNEIPERRPKQEELSKRKGEGKVEGAFVYEPKPGLYENIAMFDFTSMHTSIIISHNLSKGTLLEKKEKDCFESPEIDFKKHKTKFYFSKDKGTFPTLLNEIFELRKKYKKQYNENPNQMTLARSNAYKVLSASAHGYVAFFGARYYSKEASASILAFVRKFNKDTIKKIEDEGYKIIYGDTDSIAFLMEDKTKIEIKELLKKINDELPGVMELELDGFFKRGLWVTTRGKEIGAKKKYALIDEKGELKIRGFETVRRDWCKLARNLQNKIINLILKEGNEKKALEYTKEIIIKIKKREIEKKDLIIKTQLKKPLGEYKAISPHVIAARKMKEQEIPIKEGGLIEYYIAETKQKTKLVRDKVKLPDEVGEYEIEYYLTKQVLPAIENIFHVLKIDAKQIIENKNQKTLNDF